MAVLDSKIQDQIDVLSNAAYDKLQEKAIEEGLAHCMSRRGIPIPLLKINGMKHTIQQNMQLRIVYGCLISKMQKNG